MDWKEKTTRATVRGNEVYETLEYGGVSLVFPEAQNGKLQPFFFHPVPVECSVYYSSMVDDLER